MTIDNVPVVIAISGLVTFFIVLIVVRFKQQKSQRHNKESVAVIQQPVIDENDMSMAGQSRSIEEAISVTFRKSGKDYPWNPEFESILSFAESLGIEVESFCGEGCCGTCRTLLISGDIAYSQKPKVNLGKGQCLLCISMPKTDLVLDL